MLGRIAMVAGAAVSITMTAGAAGAQSADTAQRQDTTVHVRGLKNPALAEALGVFPGGGLFYAHAWGEGVGMFVSALVPIAAGAFIIDSHGCPVLDWSCRPHYSASDHVTGSAMIAVGVGVWAYAAVDAGRIVRRDNAKKIERARRAALTDVQPFVTSVPGERGITLGVHAAW